MNEQGFILDDGECCRPMAGKMAVRRSAFLCETMFSVIYEHCGKDRGHVKWTKGACFFFFATGEALVTHARCNAVSPLQDNANRFALPPVHAAQSPAPPGNQRGDERLRINTCMKSSSPPFGKHFASSCYQLLLDALHILRCRWEARTRGHWQHQKRKPMTPL